MGNNVDRPLGFEEEELQSGNNVSMQLKSMESLLHQLQEMQKANPISAEAWVYVESLNDQLHEAVAAAEAREKEASEYQSQTSALINALELQISSLKGEKSVLRRSLEKAKQRIYEIAQECLAAEEEATTQKGMRTKNELQDARDKNEEVVEEDLHVNCKKQLRVELRKAMLRVEYMAEYCDRALKSQLQELRDINQKELKHSKEQYDKLLQELKENQSQLVQYAMSLAEEVQQVLQMLKFDFEIC